MSMTKADPLFSAIFNELGDTDSDNIISNSANESVELSDIKIVNANSDYNNLIEDMMRDIKVTYSKSTDDSEKALLKRKYYYLNQARKVK